MNVLYWVRSPSRHFKVEVGNRVSEIQQITTASQWQHVRGTVNPADLPTRGLTADKLAHEKLWWRGPSFLTDPRNEWPVRDIVVPSELPGRLKRAKDFTFHGVDVLPSRLLPETYLSWTRLLRITAWCIRFVNRARRGTREANGSESCATIVIKGQEMQVPPLSVQEISYADMRWIRHAQLECYGEVVSVLEQEKDLPASAPLAKPCPKIDNDGILRVRGRLRAAHHLAGYRSLVILPAKHRVTKLIVRGEDERCQHSVGTNHLLSSLADRYWIIRGKQVVKSHRQNCVSCKRLWKKPAAPVMGLLPDFRTTGPLQVFSRAGVDYAGPFLVKQGRGKVQLKHYVALFTCLQTRACHLEVAASLDTVECWVQDGPDSLL